MTSSKQIKESQPNNFVFNCFLLWIKSPLNQHELLKHLNSLLIWTEYFFDGSTDLFFKNQRKINKTFIGESK